MEIYFTKDFKKSYQKLSPRDKDRTDKALDMFRENPHNPTLKNHPLKGKMAGKWVFAAAFDLRVVYRKEGEHIVLLLQVGSHNQVY